MATQFMKQPCIHCPFRKDVKPFLTPARGLELAIYSLNSYSTFPCHKTTEADEEDDDGRMLVTQRSKECAGFLTLQIVAGKKAPIGFEPAFDIVYEDAQDMIEAYCNK